MSRGFLLLIGSLPLFAQPVSPGSRDPLMALMLSQPRIEIDSAVVATAAFDPPVIGPGEEATYRASFNGLEESIDWPARLNAPAQLNLRAGAHGQLLHMVGPVLQPRTTFNYHARPAASGQFVVPEFQVMVYGKAVTVPAAALEVRTTAAGFSPPAPRLTLELPTTNLFVSQAVQVRVLSPLAPGGLVQGMGQLQLTGEGFIVDQSTARLRVEAAAKSSLGTNLPLFIYETVLIPIKPGKLSVFAQGFAAANRFPAALVLAPPPQPGAPAAPPPPQFTLLDSEPAELNVQPLPADGRLPGFTGAIGVFALSPPALSTNVVRVGDTVKLSIKVFGDTNTSLSRLVPPPAPRPRQWQVFASPAENTPPQPATAPTSPGSAFGSFVTFNYTLIALSEEAHGTPPIPFSGFDPRSRRYVDLTIPTVPVTVQPGLAPADADALLQTGSASPEPETEPGLSGLADLPGWSAASLAPLQRQLWFPLLQLVPGGAFAGLWLLERRRRFREQHPEVVRRREARRSLRRQRRELRRAARAQDAPRFAASAVNALRVACAPHYPAEPRALVGSDILALVSAAERNGHASETVRRFFAVTDASSFGPAAADATGLLALYPDLERLLDQLEKKLR